MKEKHAIASDDRDSEMTLSSAGADIDDEAIEAARDIVAMAVAIKRLEEETQ